MRHTAQRLALLGDALIRCRCRTPEKYRYPRHWHGPRPAVGTAAARRIESGCAGMTTRTAAHCAVGPLPGATCSTHGARAPFRLTRNENACVCHYFPFVSVNVSPKQLQNPAFVRYVDEAITASHIAVSGSNWRLRKGCVFITLIKSRKSSTHCAAWQSGWPLTTSTGYSSLTYLQGLPFSKLKIDRTFVANLPSPRNDVAIVTALVGLALSISPWSQKISRWKRNARYFWRWAVSAFRAG